MPAAMPTAAEAPAPATAPVQLRLVGAPALLVAGAEHALERKDAALLAGGA